MTIIKTKMKKSWLILPVAIVIGITIHTVSAWVEPDQMPPGGNIAAPLNTGNVGQSKAGGLVLNSGGATLGLLVQKGNVVIGTNDPNLNSDLTVHGNIYGRNMNLNNNLYVGGNTNIIGNTQIGGNLNVNGDIHGHTIYGDTFVVNNSNNNFGPSGLCLGGTCINNWDDVTNTDTTGTGGRSMYFYCNSLSCGKSASGLPFGVGHYFDSPIKANNLSSGSQFFYGEIKYIKGEKYSRAAVYGTGMGTGAGLCDTGYVKGNFAACYNTGYGFYYGGIQTYFRDLTGTPGYIQATPCWGGSYCSYQYYQHPTLPSESDYNCAPIDITKWDYKTVGEMNSSSPCYPAFDNSTPFIINTW